MVFSPVTWSQKRAGGSSFEMWKTTTIKPQQDADIWSIRSDVAVFKFTRQNGANSQEQT
jgi:hypothetical protein